MEYARSGRLPASVHANDLASATAVYDDGPHYLDAPRINHALRFNQIVRSAADEHVELRFDNRGAVGVRIGPLAEDACAVAGKIVTS